MFYTKITALKNSILVILIIFIFNYSGFVNAGLIIEGSNNFKKKVNTSLSDAKNASKYLAKLIYKIQNSPSTITIKAITNDRTTWHKSGKKSRSHTKALNNKSRSSARNSPVNSIIFINTNRITKTHKSYKSGTFVHELVHALDLAYGNYHSNYPIREKRAVFFQNIWRNAHSKKLRTDYHGRFKTLEYQTAKKTGKLKQFVIYYFTHNDIP